MTTQEHAGQALRTLPDLGLDTETQTQLIMDRELGHSINFAHMALGLAGELGELVNCTGTELKIQVDRPNLAEELGDLYWYAGCYCILRAIPIPDSNNLQINIPAERCFELLIQSVGDICDQVKRNIAYHKDIDRSKEMDAIYDLYVALYLFEQNYELDGNEVREKNIAKLRKRYPVKYSDEQAINRDTEAERKVLE